MSLALLEFDAQRATSLLCQQVAQLWLAIFDFHSIPAGQPGCPQLAKV